MMLLKVETNFLANILYYKYIDDLKKLVKNTLFS